MTKVAIIADTHFGVRNDHPKMLESMTRFLSDVFLPRLIADGITTVVHLGDVFDRRKYVNIVTADAAMRYLIEPLLARGINLHVLVGNHDCYYRNTNKVNSIRALYQEAMSRVVTNRGKMTVYEEPTEVVLCGVKTLMVPWIPSDNAAAHGEFIKNSKARLCLGHLELEGFDMYRGTKCEHGLKQSSFDHFDTVLSGHFHTRSNKTNVTYVGAAGQYTWADYDDYRGFSIMDTNDLSLEFVPNPYECFSKIHFDGSDEAVERVKTSAVGGRFVKLIVTDGADVNKIASVVDTVEAKGVFDLQVVDDHKHRDDLNLEDASAGVVETLDLLTSMIDTRVDWRRRDAARELALELHAEAISMTGER